MFAVHTPVLSSLIELNAMGQRPFTNSLNFTLGIAHTKPDGTYPLGAPSCIDLGVNGQIKRVL